MLARRLSWLRAYRRCFIERVRHIHGVPRADVTVRRDLRRDKAHFQYVSAATDAIAG